MRERQRGVIVGRVSLTLLIVDDQGDFRTVARLLLERGGYRVVAEAATGGEALAAAARLRPRVVLLDVGLPDVDGFTVSRELPQGLVVDQGRDPAPVAFHEPDGARSVGAGEFYRRAVHVDELARFRTPVRDLQGRVTQRPRQRPMQGRPRLRLGQAGQQIPDRGTPEAHAQHASQVGGSAGGSNTVLSLPQGGGALHGLGEKFSPDPHTGTGAFTVPLSVPSGRGGFQPGLSPRYSTGQGNGPFGLGWDLTVPRVSRRTSKGVPRYRDDSPDSADADTFVLSGAEDLVALSAPGTSPAAYRPRTEGLFAHIQHHRDAGDDYWQVRTKDGRTSYYGTPGSPGTDPAVVADPAGAGQSRVLGWLLTATVDQPIPSTTPRSPRSGSLLMFAVSDGPGLTIVVDHLRLTQEGQAPAGGGGSTTDGVLSTRRGNASWSSPQGREPIGDWELALPNTAEARSWFTDQRITDILLVLTYSGRTPKWPE